ncbi:thiamine/thiamine pyrophosphate ABC transporter permease [Ensifer soli]|uniref:thiamine/thiamine pyrophosphate ABC transporter permease n=1 Tax=Ciceribacter sp. sgz301302 TaxID=3342379 RepID=UPI0035B848E9
MGRTAGGGWIGLAAIGGFVGVALVTLLSFGVPAGDGAALTGGAGLFDAYVWRVTRFTLLQAMLSTLLSVLLAIPVARALARRPAFPGRIWIVRLMALPLGLPALVGALGIVAVWGRQGHVNGLLAEAGLPPFGIYGLTGILIAHVFFNLPLAARLLLAGLERLPGEYWRIAANLGMGPLALFRFIEWPAIRGLLPGVAGLVFMLCATSFTLVLTLGGGPAASTLEVAIYQALRFDFDPPRAIALSALQIGLTGLLLLALRLAAPVPEPGQTLGRTGLRPDGASAAGKAADAAVILLAVLFVGAPFAAVLTAGLQADLAKLAGDPMVHRALSTSLILSAISAALTVALTFLLIDARLAALRLRRPGPAARVLSGAIASSASLALLVPPLILGAGWFLALRSLGDVARFAPAIIVAINSLMALPFSYRVVEPAMAEHAARTARLAESLGVKGFHRLRWIDGPALALPLVTAFSFAAALSLGDLGAVALFGSQEIVTLPYLLYSRMGSYRTTDADGLALLMGVLCLGLTVIGTLGQRSRAARIDTDA